MVPSEDGPSFYVIKTISIISNKSTADENFKVIVKVFNDIIFEYHKQA